MAITSRKPSRALRVTAYISARDDAELLGQAIEHLCEQGVSVYVRDEGLSEAGLELAKAFVGRGLIEIGPSSEESSEGADADWLLHLDANEFPESPWLGVTLRDAISMVDALGYNGIEMEAFRFVITEPVAERVKEQFEHYSPALSGAPTAARCWKRSEAAAVPGHNVFPLPFLVRIYSRTASSPMQSPFGVGHLVKFDPVKARIHLSLRNREADQIEKRLRADLERRDETIDRERRLWMERFSSLEREVAATGQARDAALLANEPLQRSRQALERQLAELEDSHRAQRDQLQATQAECHDARERTRALESALEESRSALQRLPQLEQQLAGAAAELSGVAAELEQARSALQRIPELEARNRALETAVGEARLAAEERSRALEAALAEARPALQRIPELEAWIALLEEEQEQLPLLKSQNQELQLERDHALAALRAKAALASQLEKADAQLERLPRLEQEKQRLESEQQASHRRLHHLETENQRLDSELQQARMALGRVTELEQRLAELYLSHSWRVTSPLRRGLSLLSTFSRKK